MKNERGITLITLVWIVTILTILATVIVGEISKTIVWKSSTRKIYV